MRHTTLASFLVSVLAISSTVLLIGCATQNVLSEPPRAEMQALPGGDLPLRQVCRGEASLAAQQIPIQFRDQLAQSVTVAAFGDCLNVLSVLVSVAMQAGDTTEDGLNRVFDEVGSAEAQVLVDSCDDHYRAYRLLRSEGDPMRILSGSAGAGETGTFEYDEWMDRCFRVLRPLSRGR